MAAETKTRGRIWEHKETLLLLEKWGDENIQLQLKSCTRKKPIWLEIAAYLRAAGYEDRDDGSCKTRIHTLISAYRNYKDECSKTGNATPKKKPAFFDEVDEFLSDKPCTKPKVIIQSATISIDGVDDEEITSAENVEPNVNNPGSSKEKSENLHKPLNYLTAVTGKTDETEKPVPRQSAVLKANKKRKTASDVFAKFDKVFESFVEYQQAADKSFLEAEAARERREEERAEKRKKEDQEFLLKLAQVLHK
ncbi:uncharacterized protein [Montipora capricornis]|uniref:uncharacterized protein n=1 Tax=Montipora capricornis TaxID=246305 RepID=UPI0035F219CA